MKKILYIFLLSIFVSTVYGQEESFQSRWAISSDASTFFNFINGNSSEGIISGKYFPTDRFALMAGLSFAGYVDTESGASVKEGAFGLNLGGQYFFNTAKRFRPFVGVKIAYSAGGGVETDDDNDRTSIYTSPFYTTIGVGAEYFLTRNISLSTDVGVAFAYSVKRYISISNNGDKFVKNYGSTFIYATNMGGLGGKLALNLYF